MNNSRATWLTIAPVLVVILWLAAIGAEIAVIAFHTTTPPFYDALSYVDKARNFWSGLSHGALVNPLNVPPTIRPPGTILLAYPFGYTPAFQWFYFRLAYVPLVLLAGAVYVAGFASASSRATQWLLASMALALAGMPAFYQFQPSENLAFQINWRSVLGHVDSYLAGMAAIAMASAIRSVHLRSAGWAIGAAIMAAFCLFIKPSGLLVMAAVGVGWVILAGFDLHWNIGKIRRDAAIRGFVVKSLGGGAVVYGLAVVAAFHSAYLSPANMAYGDRALAVLRTEYHAPWSADLLTLMLHDNLGLVVPVGIFLGLFAALKRERGAAATASFCIVAGLWLLTVKSDPSEMRYFVPFAAMGFVALVPTLLAHAERMTQHLVYTGATLGMAPPLAIAILLALPHPLPAWQRAAGISVPDDAYKAEGDLAADLISELQAVGVKQVSVYQFANTPALYSFAAVLGYRGHLTESPPQAQVMLPIDWEHPSAFRFDQIRQADYVAFEPIRDERARAEALAPHVVPDFWAETRLMNAWFSSLTEADGVKRVSEIGIRLLRVMDPTLLEASLMRLQADYVWPAPFYAVNPLRWWSEGEIAQLRSDRPAAAVDIDFQPAMPVSTAVAIPTVHLYATQIDHFDNGLEAKFWAQVRNPVSMTGWYLFAHLVNANGEILTSTQATLETPPTAERNIHYYTLDFPNRPEGAVAVAFGFYRPEKSIATFLNADSGRRDWNGQRVLLPIPNP
ncbi:MAG: hypothetical protein EPO08_06315 [Rhodospirillaceae bacterium]|nr:MAG: hypothetical protein EPO08_06315 [Rhodospirillaceae bacterium]